MKLSSSWIFVFLVIVGDLGKVGEADLSTTCFFFILFNDLD